MTRRPRRNHSPAFKAKVLGISRGSVYDKPRPVSDADLKLMHRIDKLHMEFPFAGSRMLQGLLVQEGVKVARWPVATVMKRMGTEAREQALARHGTTEIFNTDQAASLPRTTSSRFWRAAKSRSAWMA